MPDLLLLVAATAAATLMLWPPRRDQQGWLAAALILLWAAIVGIGVRRGLSEGMLPWLLVLALIGALAALLVLWSLITYLTER